MSSKLIGKLNELSPKQLLILAGGVALIIFAVLYFTLNSLIESEIDSNTKQVIIAKENIQPQTRIREDMLLVERLPLNSIPKDSFENTSEIVGLTSKIPIYAKDVVTREKIFDETFSNSFIGMIPSDCRAVSINVNIITGVAGFAKPGDFVDLLLVEEGDHSVTTNVLLQNVPLLSINQNTERSVSEGVLTQNEAISNPTIATFALRPEDALKLVSASRLGEIYLMLRPFKPRNMYVKDVEITLDSVNYYPVNNTPTKVKEVSSPPVATPRPSVPTIPSGIPSSSIAKPGNITPRVPPVDSGNSGYRIEIIQGDKITQTS